MKACARVRNYRQSYRGQTDMNHSRLRLSKLSLGLIAALAAAPAFAQSTSAGIGGQVTGAAGQPVAGAEVPITDVQSGTARRPPTAPHRPYTPPSPRPPGPSP